jgi:YesN/AraC family two-component response regulator
MNAVDDALSVLVVDDSADLRELITMVIGRRAPSWAVVGTAAEGQSAIEEAREKQPDLVLLDIAMPVMDGMQALPEILTVAPAATVVMLSGYPFATAGPGVLRAGAHGYLEKTDLVKGLVPRLQDILAQRNGA